MDTAWLESWLLTALGTNPSPALLAIAIAVGTLLSEDLACIAAGILIAEGQLPIGWAALGCGGGVIFGDAALYGLGASLRRGVLRVAWVQRRLDRMPRAGEIRRKLLTQGDAFLFTSRFMPGIRFPVYVFAGAVGWPFRRFLIILVFAALLWTPTLVWLAASLGRASLDHLQGPAMWITIPAFLLATLHLVRTLAAPVRTEHR